MGAPDDRRVLELSAHEGLLTDASLGTGGLHSERNLLIKPSVFAELAAIFNTCSLQLGELVILAPKYLYESTCLILIEFRQYLKLRLKRFRDI